MVISKQFVKEVECFRADKALVLCIDECVPWFLRVPRQEIVILRVQLDIVLVQVFEKLIGTKNLGDFDKLVGVAVSMEKRLFPENHRGKHGSQRPHVKRVIIFLVINQKLGALEVARRNADIVFGALVVELRETPVN